MGRVLPPQEVPAIGLLGPMSQSLSGWEGFFHEKAAELAAALNTAILSQSLSGWEGFFHSLSSRLLT
ncbi:MAG: hypothetical protein ABDI20_01440, partial [Candidatus Bipolaricaulaceae bacterium]